METDLRKPATRRRWRILLRLGLLAAALAALHYGSQWATANVEPEIERLYAAYGTAALTVVVTAYVIAMALPYVPGIEISLALLMVLGAEGVLVVYGSTLSALCLSFLIGRMIPARFIARGLGWLHAERAQALVERCAPLDAAGRLEVLTAAAPLRLVPFLLRHRYLTLAVAFNLPGNSLLGGGGGIAMMAGMSGLFRLPLYVLLVCVAIAPIPVMILLGTHW